MTEFESDLWYKDKSGEEHSHLVMLRVRGRKVAGFIDVLRRLHYDVLAAQAMQ